MIATQMVEVSYPDELPVDVVNSENQGKILEDVGKSGRIS